MNSLLYSLVGIVIVYVLYRVFYPKGKVNEVTTEMNLSTSTPPAVLDLVKPQATVYTISFWIFLDSWAKGANRLPVMIFKDETGKNVLEIAFGAEDIPTLSAHFHTTARPLAVSDTSVSYDNSTASPPYIDANNSNAKRLADREEFTIMKEFPVQTWAFVTLTVREQVVDAYIQGKLANSAQLRGAVNGASNQLTFGSGINCRLAQVRREVDKQFSPDEVYAKYLKGNGLSYSLFGTGAAQYGANIQLKKDETVARKITIF